MSARVFVLPAALNTIGEHIDSKGIDTTKLRIVQKTPGVVVYELMEDAGENNGRRYYRRMDGALFSKTITTLLTPELA